MSATVLSVATSARAEATAPATISSTPAVSEAPAPVAIPPGSPRPDSSSPDLLGKIAPSLQKQALDPAVDAFTDVVVHTASVPALGKILEGIGAQTSFVTDGSVRVQKYVARPWGATGASETIHVEVPQSSLLMLASLPYVEFVEPPNLATATDVHDAAAAEDHASFDDYIARILAGEKNPAGIRGASNGGVSPMSWAVAREHHAYDVWQLGYEGQGINVAVVDTGEDFGNPSLNNSWAVVNDPSSPWNGWPIMFHPASMEGLMSPQFWTRNSDLDRRALPFWENSLDDNSWYSNMDYVANDSNLDGSLEYRDLTINPLSPPHLQRTPLANPQQYGRWNPATYNLPIGRSYYVGCAGRPGPCILSKSGYYRLGVARDDTLTGLWGEKVGILLVDSTTAYVYDTAYVDLNFDQNFTDDKPVTQGSPLAVADLSVPPDGVQDISGGLLYFIGSSSHVARDTVIANATGAETGANLANGWIAVNVTGYRSWIPPSQVFLNDGTTDFYLPGATEDITESITLRPAGGGAIQGGYWDLGSPPTFAVASRTPATNALSGRAFNSARLLRGPGTDYSISLVYSIFDNNGFLFEPADYQLDLNTGRITFPRDYPDGDTIRITYQLDTYTLEPV
ncbi:MAG: hypothetical protein E6K18_07865, partial [Methanobacteriota archaeon]